MQKGASLPAMRILHVSWEYPPLVYGGLGRHVHSLAEAQAAIGHDVTVLTQRPENAAIRETVNGVTVVRVDPPTPYAPQAPDQLVGWVDILDERMAIVGSDLAKQLQPEIIHAHDWVVAQAAGAVRKSCGAPLVVTVHATEAGRHQGWISGDTSRRVHALEVMLTTKAQRIIACSRAMWSEVEKVFAVPSSRIDVIPNGIDVNEWQVSPDQGKQARARWAPEATEIVAYLGRLEWEKGVHTLLDAVRRLSISRPGLRALIAGTGTYEAALHAHFRDLTDIGVVTFTGWLPDDELRAVAAAADVVAVPSLYEPFGLVALEAGALGTPLVVSNTGGLNDIVSDGFNGRVFEAGHVEQLALTMTEMLDNKDIANRMAIEMRALLSDLYNWSTIAQTTVRTYERAISESLDHPRPYDVAMPAPPTVNVLTGQAPQY